MIFWNFWVLFLEEFGELFHLDLFGLATLFNVLSIAVVALLSNSLVVETNSSTIHWYPIGQVLLELKFANFGALV